MYLTRQEHEASFLDVSIISERHRGLAGRFLRLYAGLLAFGASLALMVKADLGLGPWDVLHQGLARRFGVDIGWVVIVVGAVVLLAWVPLRQRPGVGTVSNVIVVGLALDAALRLVPDPHVLAVRGALLAAGIVANGVATGLYIGAGLGPGPRDGLMTGLAAHGWSIMTVRTLIELTVLAVGFALGGAVGVGTIAYALAIGPIAHYSIPALSAKEPSGCGACAAAVRS
jgi:uncharacterized membrane protein YczE